MYLIFISSKDFLNRLGINALGVGHSGCVNCLEWSKTGALLASGSDDLHIKLWRPLSIPADKAAKRGWFDFNKNKPNLLKRSFLPNFI